MAVNHRSITTNATLADIFIVTQPNGRFVNFGALTTTGDLASPIDVRTEGARALNFGDLVTSGNGSPGIVVGDPFGPHYDHVTIKNFGAIGTSGSIYDDGSTLAFADGINVYGDHAKVVNHGSIVIAGGQSGIGMASAHSRVINHGKIDTIGAGIVMDTTDGTDMGNTVINHGQIHTRDVEFTYGVWLLTGDNLVKNHGTIQVDGFHAFGMALEGDGNRGENFGRILATGDEGRGVLLIGEDQHLLNQGTIRTTGEGSVAIRFGDENLPGTDAGAFINQGRVESASWAVLASDADERIVNRGRMSGDVDLGGGEDRFVAGRRGDLDGLLTLGEGDDLVVIERRSGGLVISDFAAGDGSDDVLDLTAFRVDSFDELMDRVSQSGADALIDLGGGDQILLRGSTLESLTPSDFII